MAVHKKSSSKPCTRHRWITVQEPQLGRQYRHWSDGARYCIRPDLYWTWSPRHGPHKVSFHTIWPATSYFTSDLDKLQVIPFHHTLNDGSGNAMNYFAPKRRYRGKQVTNSHRILGNLDWWLTLILSGPALCSFHQVEHWINSRTMRLTLPIWASCKPSLLGTIPDYAFYCKDQKPILKFSSIFFFSL